MRKVACLTAALGAVVVAGASSPASAAMGQCFDAYGRPVGLPYNTDYPPYALICGVFRRGGSCTYVDPAWARNTCGFGPRYYRYNNRGYPRYWNRYDRYDYYDYYSR